jgi:hypothetical protein
MWLRLGKKFVAGAFVLGLAACGNGGIGTTANNAPPGSPTPPVPSTATYTLSWAAPNDPNVTGYRVYYSTAPLSSGGSPRHIDVNGSTTAIDLQPSAYGIARGATLHTAVSSTGTGGLESPVSSEVSIVVE